MHINSINRCGFTGLGAVLSLAFPLLAGAADPDPKIELCVQNENLYLATSFTNQFFVERRVPGEEWQRVGAFTEAGASGMEWFRAVLLNGKPADPGDALVFTPGDLPDGSGQGLPAAVGPLTLLRKSGSAEDATYGPLVRRYEAYDAPVSARQSPDVAANPAMVYWWTRTGETAFWLLATNGVAYSNGLINATKAPTNWLFGGIGDVSGTGRYDMFWSPSNATMKTWLLDSDHRYASQAVLYGSYCPIEYQFRCFGDSSGDGYDDLFYEDVYFGYIDTWHVNPDGTLRVALPTFASSVNRSWQLRACGDVTGDGRVELFFHQTNNGFTATWKLDTNGQLVANMLMNSTRVPTGWTMRAAGDISGDGRTEIFWQHTNGQTSCWFLNTNGVRTSSTTIYSGRIASGWVMQAATDVSGDGRTELIWHNLINGSTAVWFLNTNGTLASSRLMNAAAVSSKWIMGGVAPRDGITRRRR